MKREVVVRAVLYALIALTTPVVGLVVNGASNDAWPTSIQWAGAAATGFSAALVSVRAFIDGTNERAKKQ